MRYMIIATLASIPFACMPVASLHAQNGAFVPGTGVEITKVGDDFEDPTWKYIPNNPKSSEDVNERQNTPLGKSTNGRWYEGIKRGHPDIVRRIETPPGGLPGSTGALLMQSLYTGIPNRPSNTMHQEDFICNVASRMGKINIGSQPSVVTRVYLPPLDQWERRNGPHFAFRAALETTKPGEKKFLIFGPRQENEVYWPGMFILKENSRKTGGEDKIYFRIRSNRNGGDMVGPNIEQLGWWTLGMSFSANGAVHYYARPGVDNLTAADYIDSQYPYGYRCERFRNFFFNVVNGDNGKTWTTPFVIDDPKLFLRNGGGTTRTAARRR